METGYEMQQPAQVNFKREGAKIGLLNGLFALIILYGSYFAGLEAFVSITVVVRFIPYMILILLLYGFQLRKRNGGYLSFKQGLQYAFLSYIIADILIAIGTYILYNVIDPELTQRSLDLAVSKVDEMMKTMDGAELEALKKNRETLLNADKDTGLRRTVQGFGWELIVDFMKSLIISLIIRREKPVN